MYHYWTSPSVEIFEEVEGGIVALGTQGAFLYTENGVEWGNVEIPTFGKVFRVLGGGDKWLVSYGTKWGAESIITSDFETWEKVIDPKQNRGIVPEFYYGSFFWGKHRETGIWYKSLNGRYWNEVRNPFTSTEIIQIGNDTFSENNSFRFEGENRIYQGNGCLYYVMGQEIDGFGNVAHSTNGSKWEILRVLTKVGESIENDTNDQVSRDMHCVIGEFVAFGDYYYRMFDGVVSDRNTGLNEVHIQRTRNFSDFETLDPLDNAGNPLFNSRDIVSIFSSYDTLYVGTNLGQIFQSLNGFDWFVRYDKKSYFAKDYANFENEILIAGGFNNAFYLGVDKTETILTVDNVTSDITGIVTFNGVWYGLNNTGVVRSEDGLIWSSALVCGSDAETYSGSPIRVDDLILSDDILCAYGEGESGTQVIWKTQNGREWETSEIKVNTHSVSDGHQSIAHGNGVWVAHFSELGLGRSLDGIQFEIIPQMELSNWDQQVSFMNGVFSTVNKSTFWYSEDGLNWKVAESMEPLKETDSDISYRFHRVENTNYAFSRNRLWETIDCKNWTEIQSPSDFHSLGSDWTDIDYCSLDGDLIFIEMERQALRLNEEGVWVSFKTLPLATREIHIHPISGESWLFSDYRIMAPSHVIDKPRVTIERLSDHFIPEGANGEPAFSVKRTGDLNQPLDVYFQVRGNSTFGVDYIHNIEPSDDHFKLCFGPGYPELHITLSVFNDGEVESYYKDMGLRLLRSDHYNTADGPRTIADVTLAFE